MREYDQDPMDGSSTGGLRERKTHKWSSSSSPPVAQHRMRAVIIWWERLRFARSRLAPEVEEEGGDRAARRKAIQYG